MNTPVCSVRTFARPAVLPLRDDRASCCRRIQARMRASKPVAPAIFYGVQDCEGLCPDIELFNLTTAISGIPAGSTVSRAMLEQAGFFVPSAERISQGSADSAIVARPL